jgi:hypothetical protein
MSKLSGIPLEELLGKLGHSHNDDPYKGAKYPLPEAQIETLKELADRYAQGCPFSAGDIITPRPGYNLTSEGIPHVVLEVFVDDEFGKRYSPSVEDINDTMSPGVRIDIRTGHYAPDGKTIIGHIGESWQYESWADYLKRQEPKPLDEVLKPDENVSMAAQSARASDIAEKLRRSGWGPNAEAAAAQIAAGEAPEQKQ